MDPSRKSTKDKGQPWELDGLLGTPDGADDEDNLKGWKKYAKIILPHVGLIFISCVYIIIGAVVFYSLEQPYEQTTKLRSVQEISDQRRDFLEKMWNLSRLDNEGLWKSVAEDDIENITRRLFEAFDSNYVTAAVLNSNATVNHWTFTAAIFFTSTLLTTIGYGNLVPVTFEGRMFCICYGLFGVPLILITVADIGKFLSEHIIWLYGKYSSAKEKIRKKIRCRCCHRKTGLERDSPARDPSATQPSRDPTEDNHDGDGDEDENLSFDDYVSIPVTLVLLILVGYTAVGAVMLSSLEGWTFFEGFYFSFISLTTVGFGDLVPQQEPYFMLDLLYIVIGLAITTMCIDLVGVQYIRKIHYFGRAIKDARYALVNVGGRMVQVTDLMKYAAFLHKKYGLNDPHAHIVENPLTRLYPHAYVPNDIRLFRYIDYIPSSDSLSTSCATGTNLTTGDGHPQHHQHNNNYPATV